MCASALIVLGDKIRDKIDEQTQEQWLMSYIGKYHLDLCQKLPNWPMQIFLQFLQMTVKVGVECGGRLSSYAVSGDSVICSVRCPGIGKAHSFCNLLIDYETVSESSLRQAKKVPFLLSQIVQIPKILYLRTLFVVVDFIMQSPSVLGRVVSRRGKNERQELVFVRDLCQQGNSFHAKRHFLVTTDLLGRLQLWSVATQIIKLSSLPTVRRLNKVKTIFQRSGTGVSLFCFQPFEYLKTFDPGNKIFDLS